MSPDLHDAILASAPLLVRSGWALAGGTALGGFLAGFALLAHLSKRHRTLYRTRLRRREEQLRTCRDTEFKSLETIRCLKGELVQLEVTLADLRSREEHFRTMVDNATDMITVMGLDGIVAFQNPSSKQVLGLPAPRFIGRSVFDFIHPEDLPIAREALERAISSPNVPMPARIRLRHRDGSWRLVEALGRTFSSPGHPPCIVVNTRDITDSVKLQEQLRQAQKLEALGTLAGGIAHDFNNILSAIISFTELTCLQRPADTDLQENLKQVLRACERAANLVRQILSFSRQKAMSRKRRPIAPVVEEVLRLLRSTLPSTLRIEPRLGGVLPEVVIDATQIHQVVMNLCTNAAHAMKGRQGVLRVQLEAVEADSQDSSRHPELRPGRYVCLTVSDNGHGMEESLLHRIFEPFFTTKGPGEGSGLGLSVVHGIIQDHDGVITVSSQVGVGTTFRVFLPEAPALPSEPPGMGTLRIETAHQNAPPYRGTHGPRALVSAG